MCLPGLALAWTVRQAYPYLVCPSSYLYTALSPPTCGPGVRGEAGVGQELQATSAWPCREHVQLAQPDGALQGSTRVPMPTKGDGRRPVPVNPAPLTPAQPHPPPSIHTSPHIPCAQQSQATDGRGVAGASNGGDGCCGMLRIHLPLCPDPILVTVSPPSTTVKDPPCPCDNVSCQAGRRHTCHARWVVWCVGHYWHPMPGSCC